MNNEKTEIDPNAAQIIVDLNAEIAPMIPQTGFLLVPNHDIPDGRFTPLKPPVCRDDAIAQAWIPKVVFPEERGLSATDIFEDSSLVRMKNAYERLNKLGIAYYPIIFNPATWLQTDGMAFCPPSNYELWKQWTKDFAQYAKDNDIHVPYGWNIWNEYWYGGHGTEISTALKTDDYNKMYNYAWQAIKEVTPDGLVAGPSPDRFNFELLVDFMNYCADNGLTIDSLTWHEIVGDGTAYQGNLHQTKDYVLSKSELGIKRFYNEEFTSDKDNPHAGNIQRCLAHATYAGFDMNLKAIWTTHNAISDLLKIDSDQANSCARTRNWWAYKANAELSGVLVDVKQDAVNGYYAIASKDVDLKEVKMVVGSASLTADCLTLVLRNQPFAGLDIRVDLYKVTDTEDDGLVLQSSFNPLSTRDLRINIDLVPDDIALIVVKRVDSAPGSFCLMTPDDGVIATPTPTFMWQAASGAIQYSLKVSANKDFSNPVVDQTGIVGTSYALTEALPVGTQYYWRVTAENRYGSSAAAHHMVYSFVVGTHANVPGRFSLLTPENGLLGVATTPEFIWTKAYNASSYDLVIDDNSDFSSPAVIQRGIPQLADNAHTGAVHTIDTELRPDTTYYWKVLAVNERGSRPMNGPVSSFRTKPSGSNPGDFEFISPSNGSKNVRGTTTLRWSASNGANYYSLVLADNPSFNNPIIRPRILTNAYTLEPDLLASQTTYYWKVTAFTKDGIYKADVRNDYSSFTTDNRCAAPHLKTVSAGIKSATLYFSEVNGATSYKVAYGTASGSYTSTISHVVGSPYTIEGLVTGTTFYFAVVAVNAYGDSAIANEQSIISK